MPFNLLNVTQKQRLFDKKNDEYFDILNLK